MIAGLFVGLVVGMVIVKGVHYWRMRYAVPKSTDSEMVALHAQYKENKNQYKGNGHVYGGGGYNNNNYNDNEDDNRDYCKDIIKASNMHEVFKQSKFGELLKKASLKTKNIDTKTNSQIYEIIEDMVEFGVKVGDKFYLDKFHGDHLEFFRNTRAYKVLNLDGSENIAKTLRALGRYLYVK